MQVQQQPRKCKILLKRNKKCWEHTLLENCSLFISILKNSPFTLFLLKNGNYQLIDLLLFFYFSSSSIFNLLLLFIFIFSLLLTYQCSALLTRWIETRSNLYSSLILQSLEYFLAFLIHDLGLVPSNWGNSRLGAYPNW